jgi:bacteriocin-like protein
VWLHPSDDRWLKWRKIMSTEHRELTNDELDAVSGGAVDAMDAITNQSFPRFNDGRPPQTLQPCGSGTTC